MALLVRATGCMWIGVDGGSRPISQLDQLGWARGQVVLRIVLEFLYAMAAAEVICLAGMIDSARSTAWIDSHAAHRVDDGGRLRRQIRRRT
jgi:hypothetical protein